jgi:hypothetical protein
MTAIEWLVQQICVENSKVWQEEIQQALEMEKQQLEKEFERGYTKCADTLQFILDKGLRNNYKNETHDQRSTKPTI